MFRLLLIPGNTGACCCLGLLPLLVTLLWLLLRLFVVTLLFGVMVEVGEVACKLEGLGMGGHILFISANLPGPINSRCTSHRLPISSCVNVNWSHKVVQ